MKIKSVRHQLLPIALIPIAFILYNDALRAPFVYDDRGYIVQNEAIRSLSNFVDLSGTRYVGFLSFALNYAVGGLTPFDYHLVNVLIHAANSVLVYFLVASAADTPLFRSAEKGAVISVAFVASVVFLAHPVNTQAVTYVTQRFTSLSTTFYLLSAFAFVKAKVLLSSPDSGRTRGRFFYAVSIVSTVLAMKTKEISFTIPFAILLIDWAFFGAGVKDRRGAKLRIPYYFTLLIIPLTVLAPEYMGAAQGTVTESLRGMQVQEAASLPKDVYVLTQFRVIMTYLRLMVFPTGLTIDYGYTLSRSVTEPWTLASFVFLALLLAFAFAVMSAAKRRLNAHGVLFAFGILWFFNGLLVESLLVTIQDVIFEHRLYLPGIGFIIAAVSAVLYVIERVALRAGSRPSHWAAAVLVLVLACPPLFAGTFARNEAWTDEMRLLDGAIERTPGKARLYYARACLSVDRKEYGRAIADSTEAMRLKSGVADFYNIRGIALQRLGRLDEAVRDFSIAIALNPNDGRKYYNRAVAYDAAGLHEKSIADYTRAVSIMPGFPEAYNDRGVAYSLKGDPARALEDIRNACSMGYAVACDNLALLSKASGKGAHE